MSDAPLLALAKAAGVVVDWVDFDGQARQVQPDTVRAVLAALGHDPKDPASPLAKPGARSKPALLVLEAGRRHDFAIQARTARLSLEDGGQEDLHGDGQRLSLQVDEPGYHTLEFEQQRLALAVCPPRAITPMDLLGRRAWGLAAQLYALREQGGFGDFSDLAAFVRTAGAAGADAVAISPTNALFPAAPERCSPYSPSSRDHRNILYASLTALGLPPSPPSGSEQIDWPTEARGKLAQLNAAYHVFAGDTRFDAYVAAGGAELARHALFEVLDERFAPTLGAGAWRRWPIQFRNPASAELAAEAMGLGDRVGFFLFAHWLADLSLQQAQAAAKRSGMGLGVIADLAVGLDPGGSHAWRRPDELMMGLTLGAPPDAFQAAGQGWGLTSFSPGALQANGYAPFLTTLRATLRHAGGVRIDHALGLGRLWVIPDGAPASAGAYLQYPIDDLLALVALESQRAGAVVIGEDLGVVPEGLRDKLAARGLLGMRVLPFERTEDGAFRPPGDWDERAVAMTSTHDLAPTAGWWRGGDIAWRERLQAAGDRAAERVDRAADREALWAAAKTQGVAEGPAPTEPAPAVDAALRLVAASACELALVPVEDLLGLEEAPNLPGVVEGHPNWRRRLPAGSDALLEDPQVAARLVQLDIARPR